MFKLLFTVLFFLASLNANELHDKIKNIIGKNDYNFHINLLNIVFQNESDFLHSNNSLNYTNILKVLKQNGLLNLDLDKPKEIIVEFHTNKDPVKSLKILNDTLKSLGYYYYFTKSASYDGNGNLKWLIRLKTEFAIDPLTFTNELIKKECKIVEITKEKDDKWIYKIDTQFSKITDALYVDSNEKVSLQKPLKPYVIEIKYGSKLRVYSKSLNRWYPHIVFYDEHLNILDIFKKDTISKRVDLNIPKQTKYIKITDLYTLVNIKRGLNVIIKE